jgi:hypothetical protein
MSLRRVREVRDGLAGDASGDLGLPAFAAITPGSPEAVETANEWRPVLYGYAAVFAGIAFKEMLATRQGPLGLWRAPEHKGKGRQVVTALDPSKDVWAQSQEVRAALLSMRNAGLAAVLSREGIEQHKLHVPAKHLGDLLRMFRHLEGDFQRYGARTNFVSAGMSTAITTIVKFDHMTGEVVQLGSSSDDVRDIATRSRVVDRIAAQPLDCLEPINRALSTGFYDKDFVGASREFPFDPAAFALQSRKGMVEVDTRVALADLIDPATCEWDDLSGGYDLRSGKTVRLIAATSKRSRLGCLGLAADSDGDNLIRKLGNWVGDVFHESGLWERQLHDRELEVAPEPEVGEFHVRASIVAHMLASERSVNRFGLQ